MENGHEAPPIVVNGVMFVSTPGNQVLALDAKAGTLLWRYRRPLPTPVILIHPTTRGVAVYDDKVYFAAGEGVLVALDAKTGEEKPGHDRCGQRKRLLHVARAARGRRQGDDRHLGRRAGIPWLLVAAYDAQSGKEVWKTYMVPAPGEPGSETWPKGDEWKTGGGSVWVTANYDPATKLSYWGPATVARDRRLAAGR